MTTLLENLVKSWKIAPEYTDVEAIYWEPGQERKKSCPNGCNLTVYEAAPGWIKISDLDTYRQTRICHKHGYARIYVISGLNAEASNWSPQDDPGYS